MATLNTKQWYLTPRVDGKLYMADYWSYSLQLSVTPTSVVLTWATFSHPRFDHFRVLRSTDNITWSSLGTTASATWEDSTVVEGTQYWYRVDWEDSTNTIRDAPYLRVGESARTLTFSSVPYDLTAGGTRTIPFSYSWPTAPSTNRTITVTNVSELLAARSQSNAIINVQPGTYSTGLFLTEANATDQVWNCSGAVIDGGSGNFGLLIGGGHNSNARIRINGGHFKGGFQIYQPLGVDDILLDGVMITTYRTGGFADSVEIINPTKTPNNRIAFINCDISSQRYTLFSEACYDFIVANTRMYADGSQSAHRCVPTTRAVYVDNVIYNGNAHTFRIHEASDYVYMGNNEYQRTGFMSQETEPGQGVQSNRIWFENCTWYHASNSLFQLQGTAYNLVNVVRNNTFYTWLANPGEGGNGMDMADYYGYSGWSGSTFSNNPMYPFQLPPGGYMTQRLP